MCPAREDRTVASYEVPLNMLLGEGDNSFPLKKRGEGVNIAVYG